MDNGQAAAGSPDAGDVTAADLTLRQAAALAGCSVKTLRRAIHAGELPNRYVSTAYGAQLILPYADVDAWIEKRRPTASPDAPPATLDTGLDTDPPLDKHVTTGQGSAQESGQPLDTSILVQAARQQLVAPLMAEIVRLGDINRVQAEELGALRERVRRYEAQQVPEGSQGQPARPVSLPGPLWVRLLRALFSR